MSIDRQSQAIPMQNAALSDNDLTAVQNSSINTGLASQNPEYHDFHDVRCDLVRKLDIFF